MKKEEKLKFIDNNIFCYISYYLEIFEPIDCMASKNNQFFGCGVHGVHKKLNALLLNM